MGDPFFMCNNCTDKVQLDNGLTLHPIWFATVPINTQCLMCDERRREELSMYVIKGNEIQDTFHLSGAL